MKPAMPSLVSRAARRIAGAVTATAADLAAGLAFGSRGLCLLPAATLLAFWAGGSWAMLAFASVIPVVAVLGGRITDPPDGERTNRDGLTGLVLRGGVVLRLDQGLVSPGRTTACLVVEIDEFRRVSERLGAAQADDVLRRMGERLTVTCRAGDTVGRLRGAGFAMALAPVRRIDLEVVLQLAERLQATVAEPLATTAGTVHVTASVGFCLPTRAPAAGGESLLQAAERAAAEAHRAGPSAIRAYSGEIDRKLSAREALVCEAEEALASGRVVPWFQPQLCTESGRITGFEALARWEDPERGVIPPYEFLPALEQAGMLERLGETMLNQSLRALRTWDRTGLAIPAVGVNFSPVELRNPSLVDRIRWELDGFDLAPERLTIEVLETVVAGQGDDMIVRNLHGLAELGCRIDLDDFGTGHASIGAVRRFPIARVKIDRSFIAGIEDDPEAHKMVSAILGMAERLGLDTVAEGVETSGQHALLAQLGCGHVQGFGIGRPMGFDDAVVWATRLQTRLETTPLIARKAG